MMLLLLGLLAACSDGGGEATSTTRGAAEDATTGSLGEAVATTGRILISSTAITGHNGETLLIFGPNNESEICAAIDSDSWTLEEAALTDRAADSDPCTGAMSDTDFPPGEHAVTASIFTPGSRTASVTTAALVEMVAGDVHLQLDGSKLSGATSGDPGRISVTVSEITGQAGKILIILGQNNAGSLCAVIDADAWALPTPGVLAELPGGDGGPCAEEAPAVVFPAGDTRLTVAVVVPGNPSAEPSIDLIVTVDGDVTVTIDGTRLSG